LAHNLATINGRVAMAYQGDTPWHKLGTRIEHGIDVAAALEAASLNWRVALEPLYLADGQVVSNRRAVVREGDREILSTVSGWYAPIQYPDAFAVFAPAVDQFGLTIEGAGALGRGEKAWMLFRLPTTIAPVAGDDIHGYGVAIAGHDGKTIFEFRPTPVRVVCQNTLSVAVGAGGSAGRIFGISHIGNVDQQIAQVGTLVDNLLVTMKSTGETFANMAHRHMTPTEVVTFIESVFPPADDGAVSQALAERRADVAELVWRGVGAELAMSETNGEPNAWACYNAVTEYFDHVVTGKAKTPNGTRVANTSALFGSGSASKLSALRQARSLVAA